MNDLDNFQYLVLVLTENFMSLSHYFIHKQLSKLEARD